MRVLGTLWFFVTLVSLAQIKDATGADCNITSITSTAASSLLVKWNSFPSATSYLLDVRVVNSTTIAPVLVQLASSYTEKLVQGLRPGHNHIVTLKVFQFYYVMCINSLTAFTVPTTSQITFSKAISSTSIRFEWSSAFGSDKYILGVDKSLSPTTHHEEIFTTLSGQVNNLQPSTAYNCYIYSSNSAGLGAKSLVKTIRTLVQPPAGVTVVKVSQKIARVSWNSVPTVLIYQVTASANNKPSIPPVSWNATTLALEIPNLVPCTTYTIGVSSISMFLEPGEPSNVNYTTPNILPVTEISAEYNCIGASASVTWGEVFGATSYRAVVKDVQGTTHNCTSTSSSCQISTLSCGKSYTVQVIAVADCESISNASYVFETDAYRECSSNVILYSWAATNNTAYYKAIAQASDGEIRECLTVDTSCYFTNMMCGKNYTFTVSSFYSGELSCNSGNTTPLTVVTGAQSYVVEARGNRRDFYNCTSQGNNCMLTGLECGESLSVWIIAKNEFCTTDPVLGEVAETVPCPPQNVSAVETCTSTSATLSWIISNGAVFYLGVATHSNGTVHTCVSMATECEFQDLRCGETYDAYVLATNMQCNSSNSEHVTLRTAPCAPVGVGIVRACGVNQATVSWQTLQAGGQYTAVMENTNSPSLNCSTSGNTCNFPNLPCGLIYNVSVTYHDGHCSSLPSTVNQIRSGISLCSHQRHRKSKLCTTNSSSCNVTSLHCGANGQTLTCNSSSSSCNISGLLCGRTYNVSVTAASANCTGERSAIYRVNTGPCPPQNIQSVINCGNNTASVSWSRSNGSISSVATLECSQCNVTGLRCGQQYSVNMTASDNLCTSPPSPTVNTQSVPCAASSIRATLDCVLGTATVSWQYGAGAHGYVVSALGSVGHGATCTSNSSITNCELSPLQCGDGYGVTVQTLGNPCNVSAQMNGSLITGPCASQHLTVQYSPSIAQLFWNSTRTTNFTAVAVTEQGLTASCNTSSTTCALSGLECGQIYNITLTTHSSVCDSTADFDPIKTEPCPPQNVRANVNCPTLNATVTWEPSRFAVGYAAFLEGQNGHSTSCRTNQTYCSIPGLTCGTVYYVKVLAIGEVFNSSDSIGVNMTSAPCVPTNMSAIVDCASDSALVSWSASVGAENYSVTALGSGGQEVSCSTQQNHCNISSLYCGQLYELTLTATNQHCEITTTTNVTFQSKPCAPSRAIVDKACGNDTVLLSWEESDGVDYYSARALSQGGQEKLCNSTSSVCYFSNLLCGETYAFTVTAYSGRCQSNTSVPEYLTTDPCRPENVTAHVSCDSNTVRLDWSNARGVSLYNVMATGSLGYSNAFNTSTNNLSVSLPCGQSYSVTVQGQSQDCDSPLSAPALFILAPCAPLDLVTYVECTDQTGAVSWGSSDGANMYTATATGQDGHTHLCVTNGTSCTWEDLHCGETYNVTVTANDSRCTSPRSNATYIHTAPCVPQAVMPTLDCGTGVATLNWASSAGAETYNVSADNGAGHTLQFSTNVTNGFLSNLLCGQTYLITVRALNRQCSSAPSSPANMWSVPCVPQSVVSALDCLSNSALVQWIISQGAESYLVVAAGTDGHRAKCNATAPQCNLQELHCSTSYNISVIAVKQQCNTSMSSTVQTKTAPCVPAHVQGSVDCASGNVSMSWNQSVGAVSYSAVAQGNAGYASVCNSTGTTCAFSDLLCGMNYSLAVSASDGTCVTAPSQPVVLSTVPCKAQNASVQMSCSTNTAVVTWEPSDRVTSHIVRAIGSDGHRINCTSSNDSCILTSMHCGQNYNVTVAALDGACDSSNTFLVLQSAPCAPSNILTSLLCTTQNYGLVSVSWGQANGAQSYVAEAISADGHSSSCNSSTTSCDLQGLHCGQIYNVSVYSLANGCQSVKSAMSQVQTAPCPPQNVSAQVQCALGSVQVSWSPVVNAEQFRVVLAAHSTGVISSCNSTGTQCSINNLPCNERFNLSVVAVRGSCQSQPSSSLIASAPCAPQGVNGTIDCITNSAWVSWNVNNGAESYTVLAVGDDGHTSNCSTTNTTCSVSDLGCGKSYNFTVTASNTACQSIPSSSFHLETAPCALSSIVAVAECHSSVIQVQWQRAQIGSSLYIATGEGQDRSLLTCNSSASSCNLTNVQCGMEYTIIVAASSNRCSNLRSSPYKISTAPCQPTAVEAHTECHTNDVFVSWQPSYVAREYALTVVGRSGDRLMHRTTNSNFTLTDLRCGNTYYLSVSASHANCTSVPSPNITFNTMPCKPANLTLGVHCGNSSASLSWTGSVGAVSYVGLAQSDNGTTIYCHSTNTSCSLQGLVCGTVYNFTVQASDGICNSSYSDSLIGGAAPCPPAGLSAVPRQIANVTQILRASWFAGNCPNSEYLLQVNGGILGNAQALFEVASYWTSRTFFEIPLPCGSSYNATIRARNFAGSSVESTAVSGTTVPCAPANVTYSAATTVAWNASIYATNYTVYGVTFSGRTRLCMTSQLLCSVGNISSGYIVVTASNSAGESEYSLPVLVTAGLGRR
ncbi:hypothetical protein IRJ41_010869 [Triplophysa rosa]|uniref:Fibronectin type-III domain-containing protein n=1 Tax=Triplophysa rosa TaxID=992332 RepID=A0A9W7WVV5_TRIRA|nr:hypothetical protein IRJ41_010869 [Triplophysa rosa]